MAPPLSEQGCVPCFARAPRRTVRTDADSWDQVRFGWVAVLLALATAAGVFRAYSSRVYWFHFYCEVTIN